MTVPALVLQGTTTALGVHGPSSNLHVFSAQPEPRPERLKSAKFRSSSLSRGSTCRCLATPG